MMEHRIAEILKFWFADSISKPSVASERIDYWFGASDELDQVIKEDFVEDVAYASDGKLASWTATVHGQLALVLLLDQFRRSLYRGTPAAFSKDPAALRVCLEGIRHRHDKQLSTLEQVFYYMPMQHAELRAVQEQSVKSFQGLVDEVEPQWRQYYEGFLDYAEMHRDIVATFGRFPHRNRILGRANTPDEEAFLAGDAQTFSQ